MPVHPHAICENKPRFWVTHAFPSGLPVQSLDPVHPQTFLPFWLVQFEPATLFMQSVLELQPQ